MITLLFDVFMSLIHNHDRSNYCGSYVRFYRDTRKLRCVKQKIALCGNAPRVVGDQYVGSVSGRDTPIVGCYKPAQLNRRHPRNRSLE